MEKTNIAKLNDLYREAEEVDKSVFTKMRSNVLLSAGEHYTKNVNKHFSRLRETNKLAPSTKLRLTKNHIYRVVKTYANSIISKAPGVRPVPKNESEMQDQKDAQMNHAVWEDVKTRHQMKDKFRKWVEQFTEIGEFGLKVFWNPEKGEHVGYEPLLDEETGEPVLKMEVDPNTGEPLIDMQTGEPVMSQVSDKDKPVMSGDFEFEAIPAYNLLRSPECKDMEDSEYFIVRKLVDTKILEARYADYPEKLKHIKKSGEDEFVIFDSNKASYRKSKKETMLREIYYRPCVKYPSGYYYHFTEYGVLEEGELPYGIFPVRWVGFDEYVSTPRARSIVDVARPYQAEINRSASQEATHQVTLGDDKILYQAGSKLSQGALLPGVRGVSYNGAPPTILPGRTGAQFGDYTQRTIAELYQAVFLDEVLAEKGSTQDPQAMLFRTISQKAVFVPYIEKWERFMVEVCELVLELARNYLPDDALVSAVGRNEIVNIPEFRKTTKLCYRVKLEPVSDDAETLYGKHITFQNTLQYVGKNLSREDIGKMLRNMPYVNNEDSFSDFTIDEDNAKNDMLAIERGEMPEMSPDDNSMYYIKKLTHRIKQPDFKYLPEPVQQTFIRFREAHQMEEVRKKQEMQRAQQGFIPTGGALVSVDMYVPSDDPEKQPKRARIDQRALEWLLEQLQTQGMSLDKMEQLEESTIAQMAEMMNKQQSLAQSNPALVQ